MIILTDVFVDILVRSKCSLLNYLLMKVVDVAAE